LARPANVTISTSAAATVPAATTAAAIAAANQSDILLTAVTDVAVGMCINAASIGAISAMSIADRTITNITGETVTIAGVLAADLPDTTAVTFEIITLTFASTAGVLVGMAATGTDIPASTTVVSIITNSKVTLSKGITTTISDAAAIVFADTKTAVTVKGVDSTATLSIDVPELVLYKTDQAAPDKINYTTYFTEEDTTNSGKVLQKIYQANADAVNCVMLCPTSNNRQTSDFNRLKDYRIRIDNKDLTDRNVTYQSALYFDDRHKALLNMGEQAMNLTGSRDYAFQSQTNAAVLARGSNNCVVMDVIMFPLPPSNRPKMIEVNIDKNNYSATDPATDLNDNGLILYTEIERSI
jgi:hypothetical protein